MQYDGISEVQEKKKSQSKMLYMAKLFFKNEGKIKMFPDKPKLRDLVTTRSDLQKMLKRFFQA